MSIAKPTDNQVAGENVGIGSAKNMSSVLSKEGSMQDSNMSAGEMHVLAIRGWRHLATREVTRLVARVQHFNLDDAGRIPSGLALKLGFLGFTKL